MAQASALAAFGNFEVLGSSNNYTKDISSGIDPYWVMWVLSCLDYWDATGDRPSMERMTTWIVQRLDHAQQLYIQAVNNSAALHWSREDDRMGASASSSLTYLRPSVLIPRADNRGSLA